MAPIIFLLDSRDFHGSLSYHLTFRLAGDLLPVIFLLHTDCPLGQKPLHLTPSHGSLPAFAKKVINTTSLRVSSCPPLLTSRGSPHLKGNLPANLRLAIGQDLRTKEDLLMDCPSPYGKVSPESILSLSSASSTRRDGHFPSHVPRKGPHLGITRTAPAMPQFSAAALE